jgi:hypothetical protein
VKQKLNLLYLYINHFPTKCANYSEKLSKDPDLSRVSLNYAAKVWNAIGVAKFMGNSDQFHNCKIPLKRALGMCTNSQTLAAICHNLAVMNYYEI